MQNSTKIAEKSRFLLKFQQKYEKSLIKICEDFELRAVQRCGNLVDFEKRCKMSIWTQKSALIQLRTSLLKFDDLAEKSEKSSLSNFSTKRLARKVGRQPAQLRDPSERMLEAAVVHDRPSDALEG